MIPRLINRLAAFRGRSEEHTSELQSHSHLVCRLLLEKKKRTEEHTSELQSHSHLVCRLLLENNRANASHGGRYGFGPGMECTEARDESGGCDLDAPWREALAWRDRDHECDAHRDPGERQREERQLDGARHRRAVWLRAATGTGKGRRRRCRTGTPAVSGHDAATRRVEQGRSLATGPEPRHCRSIDRTA